MPTKPIKPEPNSHTAAGTGMVEKFKLPLLAKVHLEAKPPAVLN